MLHEINSVSFPFLFIVMLYYIQRYAWTFQDLNGGAATPPFFCLYPQAVLKISSALPVPSSR